MVRLKFGIFLPLMLFLALGCSSAGRKYYGIDKTFTENMARIAVMPFGPHNQQPAGTGQRGGTGAQRGSTAGTGGPVTTVVVTGNPGPGAAGTAAGAPTGTAGGARSPSGAGTPTPASAPNAMAAAYQKLIAQTLTASSTPDAQLLTAAVESELVRTGRNRFDVIEREQFALLLRERQMNDTDFKDQSLLNIMELGEKVGVDAYLTGAIDGLTLLPNRAEWQLTARVKVIDTRAAKVWYNEIFVAHGRDRTEAVRKWARLVGRALTEQEFEVPFSY